MELCGQELAGNFAWNCDFHVNSGIFYMPQICDMGPTASLPFQRKACWGFFCPGKSWRLRPGLNPRTWVLKASALPLDHQSHLFSGLWCCNTRWLMPNVFWDVMVSFSGLNVRHSTHEGKTTRLFQKLGHQSNSDVAVHPRTETSTVRLRKPKISQETCICTHKK